VLLLNALLILDKSKTNASKNGADENSSDEESDGSGSEESESEEEDDDDEGDEEDDGRTAAEKARDKALERIQVFIFQNKIPKY
jgi:U3 small nucleolar RNA-associated protein 14